MGLEVKLLFFMVFPALIQAGESLPVIWGVGPSPRPLLEWESKRALLSEIVEKSLGTLSPGERANADSILLHGEGLAPVYLPRALAVKYPIRVEIRDGFRVAAPWGDSKFRAEPIPAERLDVGRITRIELAHSTERFAGFTLRSRTDPAAVRGEKLFVQSCVSCHADRPPLGWPIGAIQSVVDRRHPAMSGLPKLEDREIRALRSYASALGQEQARGPGGK